MLNFKDFLTEGVNDPAIFKAIFLAGGPGSGKTFVVGKTALPSLGFKIVNSDNAFETALEKAGLEMDAATIFSKQGQAIRTRSKELTGKQMNLYVAGRLGLVIDGTGKDFEKISRQKKILEDIGYETTMIFVNTDLETALARNNMRARSLPDNQVTKMWQGVQKNLGKFQSIFGRGGITIVDNSQSSDVEKAAMRAHKNISQWAKREPRNYLAKKWIKQERGK